LRTAGRGSAVLHVAEQGYGICVWAAVPVVPEGKPIRIILVATGDDEPPPNFSHVGTVVNVGGWAVLHAYADSACVVVERQPPAGIRTGNDTMRME
jgi:hypothetical protein